MSASDAKPVETSLLRRVGLCLLHPRIPLDQVEPEQLLQFGA